MNGFQRIDAPIGQKGHLSCSMLGGIFGVSHYDTPFTIAQKYLGIYTEEPTHESKESMAMGHAFEDTIARFYADKIGVHIRKQFLAYCRSDMPWFVCHPDRLVDERIEGRKIAFEVKFVSPYAHSDWGEEDTDQIPDPYLLQCQGYFFCGVPCDEVWVIRMMGNRIRRFIVTPDDFLQKQIMERVTALHDLLEAGKMPEPSTPAEFLARHPQDNGQSTVADAKIIDLLGERATLAQEKKKVEERMDAIDMEVRNALADYQVLVDEEGKTLATCKTQTSNRFDSKRFKADYPGMYERYLSTSDSRVLRYARAK